MMKDQELEYPQWQAPLQEVILEFNLDKLPAKLYRAETLIFQRLQQLQLNHNHSGERRAINDALETLRTVKRERLQFPAWEKA